MDPCLSCFFAEIHKSDGSDYVPDSLRDSYLPSTDTSDTMTSKYQVQTCPGAKGKRSSRKRPTTENDQMQQM